MTPWRPRQNIRVIAIGLHWHKAKLLAAEVLDDAGKLKGVRPLGGGVEFGETWRDALIREFHEELGVSVTVEEEAPIVLENIFVHEGAQGHEVVFAANVQFEHMSLAGQDHIRFAEDNGTECVARWFDLDDLKTRGVPLYPDGLMAHLRP